jgi:hypothetical protein
MAGLLKRRLTEALILKWADAHKARTGDWPMTKAGRVAGVPGGDLVGR